MKILIFIGLKLAEILGVCGIVGILYGIGCLITCVIGFDPEMNHWAILILKGFISLSLLIGIVFIVYSIYEAIKANWAWAERLRKK